MRALAITTDGEAVHPGVIELPEPRPSGTDLVVDGLLLGVCGTDRSLMTAGTDRFPDGGNRLVLGHESLGRVRHAPPGSRYSIGDLVVPVVRRPDPVPCAACAAGDLDLCENGRFIERGIRAGHGYGAEQYLLDENFAIPVGSLGLLGILIEPASIVAKAWERLDPLVRRPGGRALILGAGPIGLLAALLGRNRGYDVHIVDRVSHGPKVSQSRALGATYHRGSDELEGRFDAVVECSGAFTSSVLDFMAPGAATCYIAHEHAPDTRAAALTAATLSESLMRGNRAVVGVTSSSRSHFDTAQRELEQAPGEWLRGLITDVVPLERFEDAFGSGPDTIKAVITLTDELGDELYERR
ncbi:alcohol dehydrogenase catalytic domain-containing protein [Gryllotalpicola reticulitermitis]|uniref:Alcohol dehydrogenase catalytic domain-containing protein n=1 Tax=Gryllotalpicola reticulitermitis TaxID=1184153 RepID=A0ABV8Q0U4_9MICO